MCCNMIRDVNSTFIDSAKIVLNEEAKKVLMHKYAIVLQEIKKVFTKKK